MVKFTATAQDGTKLLFLCLTDRNIELLRACRPMKIIGAEVGCSHDIYILHGKTEQAIIDSLLGAGVEIPTDKVFRHHDDDRQEGGEH